MKKPIAHIQNQEPRFSSLIELVRAWRAPLHKFRSRGQLALFVSTRERNLMSSDTQGMRDLGMQSLPVLRRASNP